MELGPREYQIVKREREYHVCGEEYNVNKRESRCNIIHNIKAVKTVRISSGEDREVGKNINL